MNRTVLHVIDQTTTAEGMEMLGALLANYESGGEILHGVVVMGHMATAARAIDAGVPADCIKHVHSMGAYDPAGWRGVRRIVRHYKPWYVHAWGFPAMVAVALAPWSKGRRIATFTHQPNCRWRRNLRWMARRGWRWLATSEQLARELGQINAGRKGTVQIDTVPPGIRLGDTLRLDAATLRQSLGIDPGDGPVVLLGGEITEPAARQTYGLWASAIVQHIIPGLRVLVHTGASQPLTWRQEVRHVRQLAATAPDPKFVLYTPPEWRWLDALQLADVLLATPDGPISRNSALSAMAAGVPIVATKTPQMQALLEDGRTGLLAEVNKPRSIAARLEELLSDPALGQRLAAAARQHVAREFSAERMVAQLREIYRQPTELAADGCR